MTRSAAASAVMMPNRIAMVGPLPPPSGGMANQTRQLAELLRARRGAGGSGADQSTLSSSLRRPPSRRSALFRWCRTSLRLWRAFGRCTLVHVMANSGWSWHLFAAPAIWIAHRQRVPVVVNYRGGETRSSSSRDSSRGSSQRLPAHRPWWFQAGSWLRCSRATAWRPASFRTSSTSRDSRPRPCTPAAPHLS